MFNPTQVVIDAFVARMAQHYRRVYGQQEPEYINVLEFVGRMALENIANSDAPYHDMDHTIMVTEVGQQILRGKHIVEGGVTAHDWLHFVVALLCHDIGYVRGVCQGDRHPNYVIDDSGETVQLQRGATDASLTPFHVNRSRLFVQQRFRDSKIIDHEAIVAIIDHTRFPVPEGNDVAGNDSYPGILRAADLIGQMADIDYLRKTSRLFAEFQETGANERLGYASAADLKENYPRFFWEMVSPYIDAGLRYLGATQGGKQWIASLYAHVFVEEHDLAAHQES